MNKKNIGYEGKLPYQPMKNIYLNVNHLATGIYVLKIMNKNKVIRKTFFNKK